jgi:hypothetical protein
VAAAVAAASAVEVASVVVTAADMVAVTVVDITKQQAYNTHNRL